MLEICTNNVSQWFLQTVPSECGCASQNEF